MATKRAILAELTRDELRSGLDRFELEVDDRRVNEQLVDALVRSRRASLGELLQTLSLNRLKELCRAFDRDVSGRKADLAARLVDRTAGRPDVRKRRQRPVSAPPTATPRPVLSVRQPWAWALLHGGKTIENRTWSTRYRGRIWIHAGMRENRDVIDEAVRLVAQSWKSSPRRALEHYRAHDQRGAILGSVILIDCCWLDELTPNDPLRSNPWVGGDPCLWRVKDPELCKPWPTPGRLGLWTPR